MSVCCFTGHRTYKLGLDKEGMALLKEKLREVILNKIESGVDTFYTGMAEGVDMIAASIVLELKSKGKNVHLLGAVPFRGQADKWSEKLKDEYHRILKGCDNWVSLSNCYMDRIYLIRDEYMVDNSDCVIAVYNGKGGGTKYTIDYALKKGKPVTCITPPHMKISEL